MSISSILNIAKNAMLAQQTALQVVSNNISNVNTVGYARQEAVLNEADAVISDAGLIGTGVKVQYIMQHYNRYLETSVAKENNALEEQKTYENYFTRIEGVLDENNSQLTSNIVAFFNGWHELSADPLSVTARMDVATKATNLGKTISNISEELKNMQIEIDNNIGQAVTEINQMLNSIAELNKKIYESGTNASENSSFANNQLQLFRELSAKLDITSFSDSNGGLTVMTAGGKILVERITAYQLTAEKQSGFSTVAWNGGSGTSYDITDEIKTSSGTLKSLFDLRDNYIGGEDGFLQNTDDLAQSIMTEINSVHETGYNMNGTTGISFFKTVDRDYAINMNISDEVMSDVRNIAVTSSADNPSGNNIALAIAELGDSTVTIGGQDRTYVEFSSSIASEIGNLSKNAKDLSVYHQNVMTMVEKQRDSISGVSIDEEMSNLIKFQYAYQAAARLINVADELFLSVLGIGT
ncbi:MAG: flagellar hook-associated protein FlgK [Proteobacteria bacterium]|nr:flagellar hook-associated protein FlgK [Pseudomonadota bacterium]